MQPKVSIIVAVYNAERTLHRCLDSLLGQKLTDLEIIVVDDGSSDGSGAICDEYSARDPRIKVIHKDNEGVSKTKQLGLDYATGEFVVYLDSDDYVDSTIYDKLVEKAVEEHADIVCCDILSIEQDGERVMGHYIRSFDHEVFLDGMIDVLFGSISNRIVKRSLFQEYQVRFNPELSFGEDKLVLVEILSKALAAGRKLKISYVPEALLFYDTTANPSSLMKLDVKAKLDARLRLWEAMGKTLNLKRFGHTYYWVLVKHGFNAFWKNQISQTEFETRFSKYRDGILRYAPMSSYARLVLMASSGKWNLAQKMRWLAYGRLLSEKLALMFSKNNQI